MSVSWRALVLALAGCAATLWACDDEPSDGDDCADVDDPCDDQGVLRCAEPAGAVEACQENADGCLAWTTSDSCGERQHCEGQGECVCDDECDEAGASRCDGEVLLECVLDDSGCLFEEGQRDCTDSDQTCEVVDDVAMCAGCAEDLCDEAGAVRCQRNVVQTCAVAASGCFDWENTTDCAALDPAQACSDASGTAECVEACIDECEEAGATRCQGTVIETCLAQDDGCMSWIAGTDCSDEGYCDDTGAEAECASCTNTCSAEGDTRCAGTVVESCVADEHDCLKWEPGVDCAVLDPAQICSVAGGDASCEELSGSGRCTDPIMVHDAHFVLAGTDFTADFNDDQTFVGTGCTTRPMSADAVFSVALTAGQTVRVRETSDFDAVLSLMTTCSDAADCEFSEDTGEEAGYEYTASGAETVYVIVEPWDDVPRITRYEIRIDIVETEVCDNAIDDDADGRADCDDDECFGVGDCAAAEINCADSGDNDGDGATDCADTDCDDAPICGPYMAVYELFDGSSPIDLEGSSVLFTPDSGEPNGYSWAASTIAVFTVTPGSGDVSTVVSLDDDDAEYYAFTRLTAFPFYGELYESLYVNSNGYITLGDWEIILSPTIDDLYGLPTIAGLWTDLAPDLASTLGDAVVTVDEFDDRVAVTFENTPIWYDEFGGFIEGPNDFQMILNADGTVELDWVTVDVYDGVAGISSGVGTGAYPAFVDLIP